MNNSIPTFVRLSPAQIKHLKALDNITSYEELDREITRFTLEVEKNSNNSSSEVSSPFFETEEERIAYAIAQERVNDIIQNPHKDHLLLSGLQALSKLPLSTSNLTALKTLYLKNTSVSDLTPLASLTSLTGLYLDNTSVSDLTPLANLISLTGLNLNNTSVSDLTPLTKLTSHTRF